MGKEVRAESKALTEAGRFRRNPRSAHLAEACPGDASC